MEQRDSGQYLLPTIVLGLCALSAIAIIVVPIDPPSEHLGIGLLLGTLFGHSVLLSTWIALGPGGWWRLPLAAIWALLTPVACLINFELHRMGNPGLSMLWVSEGGIILFVQILAWSAWLFFGTRIVRDSDLEVSHHAGDGRVMQFGILHLIIATTGVAVLLGVGRLLLPAIRQTLGQTQDMAIFAFLVVVTLVMCIPLLMAVMGMKRPWLPTLGVLVLIGLGTAYELNMIQVLGLSGPDWLHIVFINLFTVLTVMPVALAVRSNGYRLVFIHRPLLASNAEVA